MIEIPTLNTARLILRPYSPADAPHIQELIGDYDVSKNLLVVPHPYPDGAAEEFVSTHAQAVKEGLLNWAITTSAGQFIGGCSMHITHHRRAVLGYWIGKSYWGQGLMKEAVEAMIAYGFTTHHLIRIEATSFLDNPNSARVMAKAGMSQEGRLRNYYDTSAGIKDALIHSITYQDWRSNLDSKMKR